MMTNRDLLQSDELEMLMARARAVTEPDIFGTKGHPLSARDVARQLGPVVHKIALTHGLGEMRQGCAWLAGRPWPTAALGCAVRDPILAMAKYLADQGGQVNVRDALAFWASETDPAVWQGVVSAAA